MLNPVYGQGYMGSEMLHRNVKIFILWFHGVNLFTKRSNTNYLLIDSFLEQKYGGYLRLSVFMDVLLVNK